MQTIKITALRHSAFYTPLLFTIAGGFLQEQGLEADYLPANSKMSIPDLLSNGEFHVSQSAVATSFAALNKGVKNRLFHFAQINQKDGFFLAARSKEKSFSWSDLEKKKVLVDHFFQPYAMFKFALMKQNIDIDKIKIIDAGSVNQIDQAFRDGTGDYVHQQGPFPQQLEADGVAKVVASVGDVVGPIAFSSLCAHEDWLSTDMAYQFLEAYQNACTALMQSSAKEVAKMIRPFLADIELKVLRNTVQTYLDLGTWSDNISISEQSYNNLMDVFEYNGLIDERYHPSLMIKTLSL